MKSTALVTSARRPFTDRPSRTGLAALLATAAIGHSAYSVQSTAPSSPPPAAQPSAADEKRSPVGYWQGMVLAGNGALFVRIHASLDGGHAVARVTLPQAGALKQDAVDVSIEGAALDLTLKAAQIAGRFKGEIAEDGTTYAGDLTLSGGVGDPLVVPFTLGRTGDAKSTPGAERWEGVLAAGGAKIPMALTLAESATFGPLGAIDIPMQSLEDFPALVTKAEGGRLVIRLPVGAEAVFELTPKDNKLVGELRQAGAALPVEFSKAGTGAVAGLARPQLPVPPFPYVVREVTIPHRFGHTLAGTLTLPQAPPGTPGEAAAPKKFPAVVLVSGSGPQDRDETIFGHKPFLLIADALTRAGIAVLRYDDRGIGKSTGEFGSANSHDFAADCDEATEWLRRQPDVDATRIGIIGHSEGGLIAPMVAKWQWEEGDPATAVRFIVLLAGPGVSGGDVLTLQMRKLMATEGATPEEIEAVSALQAATFEALRAEKKADELTPFVRALVAKQLDIAQAHGKGSPGIDLEALTQSAVGEIASPWMRTFVIHDPRSWITALPIPVLAMQGGLDLQVDPQQNLPAIEAAAKEGNVALTVKQYPNLNHLFQPAKTGAVDEYGTIETTFDPVALKDLVDWVVARANDPALQSIKPKSRAASNPIQLPSRPTSTPSAPPAPTGSGVGETKPASTPAAAPAAKPEGTP